MANTLSNLIPDVYAALDVVSRELVGFIPSVARNSTADRVATGQTLRAFQTPANTAGFDIAPSMTIPSAADQTILNKTVTITKSRSFPFSWSGEEQYAMNQGPGFLTIKQDQIAQALRTACNEIELALANTAYQNASRAFGTAGTTPFTDAATGYNGTVNASAQLRKILDDNGAPASDRTCVLGTTAGAALRSLFQVTKANEAGTSETLRNGTLLDLHGIAYRESAQVAQPAIGTGSAYTSNSVGYPKGATVITLITGSGTVLQGDVVTFAGDTNKYVVAVGTAAPGTITLAQPGLQKPLASSAVAMTIGSAATMNVGFSRNALVLATRLPAIPEEGDLALDRETVTDPRSGLSFEIALYPGFRMNVYHLSVAYGTASIKPEHCAILLG